MNKKLIIILVILATAGLVIWSLFTGRSSNVDNMTSDKSANNETITENEGSPPSRIEDAIQSEGMITEGVTVSYEDNGFVPQEVTVNAGETVTWVNNSGSGMWVASAVHPTHEEFPQFDQLKEVGPGGEYSFIFNEIGSFRYHNHISPQFTGTVIVSQ